MSQWKSHCVNTSIKPMDLDLKINLKFETIFLTEFRNAQFFYIHIILLMQWLSTVLNVVTEHYASFAHMYAKKYMIWIAVFNFQNFQNKLRLDSFRLTNMSAWKHGQSYL